MSTPQPAALILVPGLMSDDTVWRAQIELLQARIPIIVADHGELDSLAAMASRILNHAPSHFALAGHSMGGRVALEVMRQASQRVTHLALLDTGCRAIVDSDAAEKERASRYGLLKLAQQQGLAAMARQWVLNMVHPDHLQDTKLIAAIVDMFASKSIAIYAAQVQALLNRPEALPLLKDIHCPTLVLCGSEDTSATPATHREMAEALPNAHFEIVAHCGHMSMQEQPAAVTASLRGWLDG